MANTATSKEHEIVRFVVEFLKKGEIWRSILFGTASFAFLSFIIYGETKKRFLPLQDYEVEKDTTSDKSEYKKGMSLSNSSDMYSPEEESQLYRIRNLILEVQEKAQTLRETELLLSRRLKEVEEYREDHEALRLRLRAEEELRKLAESKSSMMQTELARLHRILGEHKNKKNELISNLKIQQLNLELYKAEASVVEDNESAQKVQKMIREMELEYQQSQEEKIRLAETNKILTQQSLWEKERKDQLLFEIETLKQRRVELITFSEFFRENGGNLKEGNTNDPLFDLTPEESHWRTRVTSKYRTFYEEESFEDFYDFGDLEKEFDDISSPVISLPVSPLTSPRENPNVSPRTSLNHMY